MEDKMVNSEVKEKEEFIEREYQVEIFEKAIHENVIVYLPTGSGKTYIAGMVIKSLSQSLQRKFSEGGKRSFFLVNTVALVAQQANSLRRQLPLEVSEYNGSMGVDYWDKNTWHTELEKNQVLVMTAQIFLNMLAHNYVSLSNLNLLILDECHHAVNQHPMRQIMQDFENCPPHLRPRVLGLTATLINANCDPEKVEQEIHNLEITIQSKIVTALNNKMVQVYSANPNEEIVSYEKHICTEDNGYGYINDCVKYVINVLQSVKIKGDETDPAHSINLHLGFPELKKNMSKRIMNAVSDILDIALNLGIYAASKAALARIVMCERLKCSAGELNTVKLLNIITTRLHLLRKQIQKILDTNVNEGYSHPFAFSSPKLRRLISMIRDFSSNDLAIVFVEKRITAKVLHYIFQELHENCEQFSKINPGFVVGFNTNPFSDTRELLYERKVNLETLKKFNSRKINVLFSSDVIEEGIDVQLCNYVIKFDNPKTFRSYVQSKGRARDPKSKYYLFAEAHDTKFSLNHLKFKNIETTLKKILCGGKADDRRGGTETEVENELYNHELPPYFANPCKTGPKVTAYSAISLINRYCNSLPRDKFSTLTVSWWIRKTDCKYVASLKLPINSRLKHIIEGLPFDSKLTAKKYVALKTCEMLHKLGELDDNFLPRGSSSEMLSDKSLYPMWDDDDNDEPFKPKPGTKKKRRIYDKHYAKWVHGCRPVPNKTVYLHIIVMTPNYIVPNNHRQVVFHSLIQSTRCFSILTTTKWPQICQFPLFMNVGEITIDLNVNAKSLSLTDAQISSLINFHSLLFTEVLPVVKNFVVRDYENKENSYLIVPTFEDVHGNVEIDWDTVYREKSIPKVEAVSLEARKEKVITVEDYDGKIVVPWYRPTGNCMRYVVTRVCLDQTPESQFPSDNFKSYAHYFKQRYNQTIVNMKQPLIEVRAISSKISCLLPRGKSRHGSSRRRKDDEDYEETLVPELCCLLSFPAVYMLKVTLLPSVLHRIDYLLLAEELRQTIVEQTNLGIRELTNDMRWKPLTIDKNVLTDKDLDVARSTVPISDMLDGSIQSITVDQYPWRNEQEPTDINRSLSIDLLSIIHYEKFISKPVRGDISNVIKKRKVQIPNPKLICQPLSVLEERGNIGPEQCEILQVLTASTCNDIINYERMETLGDSFLKFAVSLALFTYYQNIDEGKLTQVKGKIIGNRNLFYCGRNIKLGQMLKVFDCLPIDWNVPGFTFPRSFQKIMKDAKIPTAILYRIPVSDEERDSGILTDQRKREIVEAMCNSEECDDTSQTNLTIIGAQVVSDKTIADAVEALIGAYLKACGITGAFKIVNWLGILPDYLADIDRILNKPPVTALISDLNVSLNDYLVSPDIIEVKLGYKFKDRSYLLQALSHPSSTHILTDCYQRLEFLGDAILDFLITAYIYDNCGDLNPGELTDLRSALVNNVTFACLTVRYGFHQHLVAKACKLADVINRFVQHQEIRNHTIGSEVLFLIEENDVQVAESIDVPKVLGDLFESLAGAVYLDSNKCLKTVWNVFYRLMANEISVFSKDVPRNHIRLLYEQFPNPPLPKFGSVTMLDDKCVIIPLEVTNYNNSVPRIFHGIGENKAQAKLAAAKIALRYYHTPKSNEENSDAK